MDYLLSLFRGHADADETTFEGGGLLKKSDEEGVYYSRDNLKNFKIKSVSSLTHAAAVPAQL